MAESSRRARSAHVRVYVRIGNAQSVGGDTATGVGDGRQSGCNEPFRSDERGNHLTGGFFRTRKREPNYETCGSGLGLNCNDSGRFMTRLRVTARDFDVSDMDIIEREVKN